MNRQSGIRISSIQLKGCQTLHTGEGKLKSWHVDINLAFHQLAHIQVALLGFPSDIPL
ncbi:hypothetical protein R4Z09_14030 [Niallia oryzisoli]|uniref:Uncharacterized protein n=1 Tax=Niallia oryzisoli TaxID=1737571 RepID=A0ABZ2CNR7_9BACI